MRTRNPYRWKHDKIWERTKGTWASSGLLRATLVFLRLFSLENDDTLPAFLRVSQERIMALASENMTKLPKNGVSTVECKTEYRQWPRSSFRWTLLIYLKIDRCP